MVDTSTPPGAVVRARPPSPKLALIVVGVAALIMACGALASLLTGGNGSAPANPASATVKVSSGLLVHESPATAALGGIEVTGEPPSDILSDLDVPTGSASVSTIDDDSSAGYDRTDRFTVGLSQADVISFFQGVLHANGWEIISSGATGTTAGAAPGFQILAKHGSEDGYYWELGVQVYRTTFAAAPASSGQTTGGTASATGVSSESTPFTVRLFEVADND